MKSVSKKKVFFFNIWGVMEVHVINLITNRTLHFLHVDLFLIEYFFYIFLTPKLTLRSWDNHQLKRKSE
jgi:hypothetical protein